MIIHIMTIPPTTQVLRGRGLLTLHCVLPLLLLYCLPHTIVKIAPTHRGVNFRADCLQSMPYGGGGGHTTKMLPLTTSLRNIPIDAY